MTFCIGIRTRDGIVALSDTRVVRGAEMSSKMKLSMLHDGDCDAVVMTSGLRSVRDKVVVRLEDTLIGDATPHGRLHELATAYGDTLRIVRGEDEDALVGSGLTFNSHAILGGQFPDDPDPVLMHIYPEGNWVEATSDAPYVVVGRTSYGKPILDRLLHEDTPLDDAIALAYLAFDATRASANDVDFPIDVAVLRRGGATFTTHRFSREDLAEVHEAWQSRLSAALTDLPNGWTTPLLTPDPAGTPS